MKKPATKKKEKGGKKARLKRKLERQWGEVERVAESDHKERRGRRRLIHEHKRTRDDDDHDETEKVVLNYGDESHSSSSDEEEDAGEELIPIIGKSGTSRLSKLISKLKNKENDIDQTLAFFTGQSELKEAETSVESENLTEEPKHSSEISEQEGSLKPTSSIKSMNRKNEVCPYTFRFEQSQSEAKNKEKIELKMFQPPVIKKRQSEDKLDLEIQISGSQLQSHYIELSERNDDEKAPQNLSLTSLQEESTHLFNHIKPILSKTWSKCDDEVSPKFTRWQSTLFPALSHYADLFLPVVDENLVEETDSESGTCDHLLALHLINHCLTSRQRIQQHDKLLRKKDESDTSEDPKMRDQGYTRPKVLVVLPTRGTCHTFVCRLLALLQNDAFKVEISHLDRFETEFGAPPKVQDTDDEMDEEDRRKHELNKQRKQREMDAKGTEWNKLFGEHVNDSDDFKMGIGFGIPSTNNQKKKKEVSLYVNLYSDFYKSDLILASPLGLLGATKDYSSFDFLSSIEICWIGHCEVMLMQNWDHVTKLLNALNQQPSNHTEYEIDFSRVRPYFLDGHASLYRQLILTSKFNDPLLNASFKNHSKSSAGFLKVRRIFDDSDATLADVDYSSIKQIFQRIPCQSFTTQGEVRVRYLNKHILPQLNRLGQKHTMVFIPSFFDYVLLRNALLEQQFKREAISFVTINEYSEPIDVRKAKSRFRKGTKRLLLYTGRAHFFFRHQIRGIKHLIFLGLPEQAEFYPELINMLLNDPTQPGEEEDDHTPKSSLALFTKYDALSLERLVGSQHCENMINDEKSTFVFS